VDAESKPEIIWTMQDVKLVVFMAKKKKKKKKKREYLRDKINELKTDSKYKNIRDLYRGINEFEKGYQSRTYLVKDENDLLANFHISQYFE
jgi:hypothetical protein